MLASELLNLRPPRVWITGNVAGKDVHSAVAICVRVDIILPQCANRNCVSINRNARAHHIARVLVTHLEPGPGGPVLGGRCVASKDVGAANIGLFGLCLSGVQHRIFCIGSDDNRVAADSDRVSKRRGPVPSHDVDDVRVPGRVYFLHLARPKFPPPNPVGVGIIPRVDVDGAVPEANIAVVHLAVAVVVDARPRVADDDGISVDGDGSSECPTSIAILVDDGVRARVGSG